MIRKDYTTLVSHYIPNETKYHFQFPINVLEQYNGAEEMDVTLDDNLVFFIIEPIIHSNAEYNYELIWKEDILDVCVKVNDEKFDSNYVIENLKRNNFIKGLHLLREEYGEFKTIYS